MNHPYEVAQKLLQTETDHDFTSIGLYGTAVYENGGDHCASFHLENESGTGQITLYPVFPGIELIYNDIHMGYCKKEQKSAVDMVEINYCKEGRSECLFGENQFCYMAAGDLSFCSLQDHAHQSEFPTAHYHGITITIDFSKVTGEMKKILELLSVDLERIKEISRRSPFTIIRADETIEHIFQELYRVPEQIRYGYIRVKVLELLLVLMETGRAESQEEKAYFSQSQTDAVKQIHGFLVEHYSEHYTIDWLSEQFGISSTIMKRCFKEMYGDSMYAYMKRYRLQVAESLLRKSKLTVGEIAAQIGYMNPNKFTSAFTDEYGMSPSVFRRKCLNG